MIFCQLSGKELYRDMTIFNTSRGVGNNFQITRLLSVGNIAAYLPICLIYACIFYYFNCVHVIIWGVIALPHSDSNFLSKSSKLSTILVENSSLFC